MGQLHFQDNVNLLVKKLVLMLIIKVTLKEGGIMPCFYGNGDDIDANDGGNSNFGLAQLVGVMRCKDTDGGDVDVNDDDNSNLGLAQVVGVRSW